MIIFARNSHPVRSSPRSRSFGYCNAKRTKWRVVQPSLDPVDNSPTLHDEAMKLLDLVKKGKQMAETVCCSSDTVGQTIIEGDSVLSRAAPCSLCPEVDMEQYSDAGSQLVLLNHVKCHVKRLQKLSFSIRLALNEMKERVSLPFFIYINVPLISLTAT